jgi:hypothetical protein
MPPEKETPPEPDAQDVWLNERLGLTAAGEVATADDAEDEPEAETPAEASSAEAAGKLEPADEEFAFQWLARGRIPRAAINEMLAEKPLVALAIARQFKDAQDTIARLRRGSDSADEDNARPSDSAPGRTAPASPEEHRRAEVLQLVEDELGEKRRQALEREWPPQGSGDDGGSPAVDPRTLAALVAAREQLVANGHEELRGKAAFQKVLQAADALQAADPTLSVRAAILEAAEIVKARTARGLAESQKRKRALALAQPTTGRGRGAPMGLSKEQARDRHLDALIARDKDTAEALVRRYKLNER